MAPRRRRDSRGRFISSRKAAVMVDEAQASRRGRSASGHRDSGGRRSSTSSRKSKPSRSRRSKRVASRKSKPDSSLKSKRDSSLKSKPSRSRRSKRDSSLKSKPDSSLKSKPSRSRSRRSKPDSSRKSKRSRSRSRRSKRVSSRRSVTSKSGRSRSRRARSSKPLGVVVIGAPSSLAQQRSGSLPASEKISRRSAAARGRARDARGRFLPKWAMKSLPSTQASFYTTKVTSAKSWRPSSRRSSGPRPGRGPYPGRVSAASSQGYHPSSDVSVSASTSFSIGSDISAISPPPLFPFLIPAKKQRSARIQFAPTTEPTQSTKSNKSTKSIKSKSSRRGRKRSARG